MRNAAPLPWAGNGGVEVPPVRDVGARGESVGEQQAPPCGLPDKKKSQHGGAGTLGDDKGRVIARSPSSPGAGVDLSAVDVAAPGWRRAGTSASASFLPPPRR